MLSRIKTEPIEHHTVSSSNNWPIVTATPHKLKYKHTPKRPNPTNAHIKTEAIEWNGVLPEENTITSTEDASEIKLEDEGYSSNNFETPNQINDSRGRKKHYKGIKERRRSSRIKPKPRLFYKERKSNNTTWKKLFLEHCNENNLRPLSW